MIEINYFKVPQKCSCKNMLKKCIKFTGEQPCRSAISIMLLHRSEEYLTQMATLVTMVSNIYLYVTQYCFVKKERLLTAGDINSKKLRNFIAGT